jgi:hypothetical protein
MKGLGETFREYLAEVRRLETAPTGAEMLDELRRQRADTTVCMLEAVKDARFLAMDVPRSDPLVQQAMSCERPPFATLEELVVTEAERIADDTVRFALGLYWSEVGVQSAANVPLFGTPPPLFDGTAESSPAWTSDESGGNSHRVPAAFVRAEALLLQGQRASVDDQVRAERGAMRALRLYQHAKSLALVHHDAAAETRYVAAAEAAASHNRTRLAAHSLTRLSYFLSLRADQRRALDFATRALRYDSDPLAEYLEVTLKRSLGLLRTAAEVVAAEKVLETVAGQLPSKLLEDQREEAHKELMAWRKLAAEDGIAACAAVGDAARFLLCAACRLLFGPSSVETSMLVAEGI